MASKDVEMKEVQKDKGKKEAKKEDAKEVQPPAPPTAEELRAIVLTDLRANIALCIKTNSTKEIRFVSRAVRKIPITRRQITAELLITLIKEYFPALNEDSLELLHVLTQVKDDAMEVEESPAQESKAPAKEPAAQILPEVQVYLHLLVIIFLLDKKRSSMASAISTSLIQKLQQSQFNRRTLDPLLSKAYFYYSSAFELQKDLASIRSSLLSAYRTATLRHDKLTQATLLNLLLRNYLEYNLYDQAEKLLSKANFGTDSSTNQYARYLYYTGRVAAIQLDYTKAYRCLLQSIRKAPQNSARGFRITVQKLICIVQLLMGELPEKSVFRQKGLKTALKPYFDLTLAVRIGDLVVFENVVKENEQRFRKDQNFTLIQRLRSNVIKTGLRKINVSYSRIQLTDICAKLHLESVEDAAFIVAKAIRDGVIDATIDYKGGFLQSKENIDIYSTQEPQDAFHKRIVFCLDTHNDAVKAMSFPPDAHKADKESEEERNERIKQEEIAKTLAEEDDDEEGDF